MSSNANDFNRLSVCIPTYNRAKHLANCLHSISRCFLYSDLKFEVCVSDNNSGDETAEVVQKAQLLMPIKYHKNKNNIGYARNYQKVVSMAGGEFIWLIGDDDLLMPYAIKRIYELVENHPNVDFFFLNSFHLTTEYIDKFPTPFDFVNLPPEMEPFSKFSKEGELPFLRLIHPKVSFDFLGGMFLSIFRRENWLNNTKCLDRNAILDPRVFSHFDNTFPHVKIFANAFSKSTAYFNKEPLNICLTGAREWSHMSSLVMSVRLVEAVDEYRKVGLPLRQYWQCRNYALRNFIPDLVNMWLHKERSGFLYVKPFKLIFENFMYPNFYLSFFYFFGRKLKKLFHYLCKK